MRVTRILHWIPGQVQIRSSKTHPLRIAELAVPGGGAIGITFCPGKCAPSMFGPAWQRDLEADLEVIQQWGAQVVVTLVERFELAALQVAALGERVQARGMRWLHLPIVDVGVPSAAFERRWSEELAGLLAALRSGGKVLVHCKGGLGRAGLVASLLLIEAGERPEAAIRRVRQARPGAIETPAQQRYVLAYQRRGGGP